jgi:hypothetical protein
MGHPGDRSDPHEQDEWETLHAEVRSAAQHRDAEYERMVETQRELERLIERARSLLARARPEAGPAEGPAAPPAAGS